ncbi:MAG TPA: spore maturation protein A [Candidatus Gallacutalibacter stercoravium]|nr:spore maturation protein A [Candidatus Gallacutalibacter stercoravium]
MMNYIWGALILISIVCAACTGHMQQLSDAVLTGAGDAVELVVSLLGMMCLWSGLMKIADAGGLTALLAKALSPVMRRLFPDYPAESPAIRAICMNITANLLGLGNAATPMGIAAMKEMEKSNPQKGTANNSMVMFVVINTASLQLFPTMMIVQRARHGAASPFDILPAVWIVSVLALLVGVLTAKALESKSALYAARARRKGRRAHG